MMKTRENDDKGNNRNDNEIIMWKWIKWRNNEIMK